MRDAPYRRRALLAASALIVLIGCAGNDDVDTAPDGAVEQVDAADNTAADAASALGTALDELGLTSLASAVEGIDLEELLDVDEYTFFAPSDEAFTSLSADGITDLLADPARLVDTLENHLVEGRYDTASLSDLDEVTTAYGDTVSISSSDGLRIGDAALTTIDVSVGDVGIIHVVDALLIPDE